MKAIVAFLTLVFAIATTAEAGEIQFAFHLDLPARLSQDFRFLYRMKQVAEKEVTANVDIPGLPVVSNQRMPYVVYSGVAPNGWEGGTLNWYTGKDCSVMDIHVAIRDRSDALPVLYNELFQLGFRRAVIRKGVNLCEAEKRKQQLYFLYAGRQWSNDQLEEAASEIGTIRALTKLGKASSIADRFHELAEIQHEQYKFIQFLVRRAQGDPKKYEAELKQAIESFLDRYRKK